MTVRNKVKPSISDIIFAGGRLCLDFVNTTNWIDGRPVDERLHTVTDIATWAVRQKISASMPTSGDITAFHDLRQITRRLLLDPEGMTAQDLGALNQMRSGDAAPLKMEGAEFTLEGGKTLDWLKRLIADSAVEVALTVDPQRLKICNDDHCGWIFVDESPNNRRRWCSMATCGNRAKAKRHYETSKAR